MIEWGSGDVFVVRGGGVWLSSVVLLIVKVVFFFIRSVFLKLKILSVVL